VDASADASVESGQHAAPAGEGSRCRQVALARMVRERRGRRMLRDLLDKMRHLLSAPAHEDKNALLTRLCAVLARPPGPDGCLKLAAG
jgi:hypothetical protein